MEKTKALICPYCGEAQPAGERCRACGGLFEPLSRQATHNAMGPWFVRDPGKPFHPGCSYETLVKMIDRGQVTKTSIIRGPTTKQYWALARRVPGVAHLLGYCHGCDARVDPEDHGCHACGESFGAYLDRNYLGLPEIRPLPWEAQMDEGSLEPPSGFGAEAPGREAAGGGLSHFASDDELLGGGGAPPAVGAASAPTRQWARPRPVPAVAAHAPASMEPVSDDRPTVFDDSASAAVTRALRRRLASQQRTIRVMAILLVVGLVIVLVSNLAALAKLVGRDGASTQAGPAPAGVIEELEATVEHQQPAGGLPGAHDGAGPPGLGPATAAPPEADAVEDASTSPEAAIIGAYGKALELISAAAEADRSLEERIRDYEQALESLQSLGGSPPPDQQPAELADLIERVERELERLRLEDFFG